MSLLNQIGVMILTYNEAPNIERTLEKLGWAKRILIVDSGSTDETIEIAERLPQVAVIHHAFDNFANQCNFGLDHIATDWVLSLDADYVLSDAFIEELRVLQPHTSTAGFEARFAYCVHGKALHASLYPARIVLYRRALAKYRNEGHGHRVSIDGQVHQLRERIFHDDRKPMSRWLRSQSAYARIEADFLLDSSKSTLRPADRLRLMGWPAPFVVVLYALFAKGCILDGWRGWFYVLQRCVAESLIAIEIVSRRLGEKSPSP